MPIIGKIVNTGVALARLDKRGWDKLYFGIRKDIKLGIKHGFGAGSIIGEFINSGSIFSGDASIPFQSPSGSFPKARGGQAKFRYRRYRRKSNFSQSRRCTCARKFKRRRNRMYR